MEIRCIRSHERPSSVLQLFRWQWLLPSLASASTAADVTFAYSASGSTVSNTITNNSGGALQCSTSLANAPGGVLPPIEVTIGPGQTIYESGVIPTGTTVQTINDIPGRLLRRPGILRQRR